MTSSQQNNNFKQKVFCMNNNPPIEVSGLDHSLMKFSSKIKPDEATIKTHRGYAQRIVEVLKTNSSYDIDRFMFAGSFGKRTNVLQSDADCVFFINNENPPYDKVITEFYAICNRPEVKNSFNSYVVEMKRNSINFKINGLEMDVVIATNFVNHLKKGQSLAHVQQKEVLQLIKLNPTENCYKYSTSLAEATVYFMKTRVSFANEMARIAKYWFKSLGDEFKNISGASTFIELVAVYAARKGRHGNRKFNPYLKSFIRFLDNLMNFERLNVSFNRCNAMFKEHPPGDSKVPRVIDPVDPYNNFASYWHGSTSEIETLKNHAASTMDRLHDLVLNSRCDNGSDVVETLFN
ncbi:uncharacterized protein LOC119085891 [Bradysia coprophila]|uniref:uncharacterized protein LOC119085891 n=1 Tax=Bradysia coprophila TaxID=38358 RepID=UPI00187DA96C|nr:uncharacterized protein LOC119085891 [Bradysia coprophila]